MWGALFLALALLSSPEPVALLLAVAIHELAHIITARLFGWKGGGARLWGVGFKICYYGLHSTISRIGVSLSGCAVGIALYFIPFFDRELRLYSLGLSLLNLLPITGLDGGEAFIAAAEALAAPGWAYFTFRALSFAFAAVLWVICTAVQLKAGPNVTLLAVTLFLTIKVFETEKNHKRKG